VSLLFPPVQTVNEALTLLLLLPGSCLLLLLGLVAGAWRWGMGSWTLVIFLSFPLVMQQCVIVSTDTVHNLGTLLAVLLFRRHQLMNTTASWLLLVLISCLVVIGKPPIYLTIFLLPAWFLPWQKVMKLKVVVPSLIVLAALAYAGNWYLWYIIDKEGMGLGEQTRQQLQYVLTGPGLVRFIGAAMEYPTRFLDPQHWWQPLGWLDTNLNDLHRALLWISLIVAVVLDLVRWIAWLRSVGTQSLWSLIEPLVGCVAHLLFVWWSLALVMYLTISDYQSTGIVGMQVRYMIPVALFFLTWPAAVMTDKTPALKKSQLLWPAILLFVLAIARAIQLAIDLHYRYWG